MRYRLRLQREQYPAPPLPFPPLVNEPAPLFRGAQVALGRALGRGYLWFDRLREHFRIERSRLRDRFGGPRLAMALVRQQGRLLASVLTLIIAGFTADVVVTRYGHHLAALPGGHFLARRLNGPSPATVDSALTATATATGAVLGLVLTISLITFQTTATRYRSDRIVAFLVRERVGSVVVRLLAAGFLFSLWLLYLRDVVTGYPPYVSTVLAVAVATAGIGSLIGYRLHALLGLAPENVFLALEREVRRELSRLTRKRPGRSVEAHSRRTAESDLEIAKDMLRTLAAASDWRGSAAGVAMLGRVLDDYIRFKRTLPERSQWFRPMPVRLGSDAYAITLNFARLGRLPVTDVQPERDWFEREIYEAVDLVPAAGLEEATLRNAVFILHGHVLQLAWAAQEWPVLDHAFASAEALATAPEVVGAASAGFLELPWVAVHDVARGLSSSPEQIVANRPWRMDAPRRLPRSAREIADELGRKIRKEIALTGAVVTPEAAMIAELTPPWEQLAHEKQTHYLARSVTLATAHLHAVVEAQSATQAATAAETTLRILVLAYAEGARPLVDMTALQLDVAAAYQLAAASERLQLREEGVWVALRTFAERGEVKLAVDLLKVACAIDLFEQMAVAERSADAATGVGPVGATTSSPDATVALRRFELLLHFSYVYGWAEYHQVSGVLELIDPLLVSLFPLEKLLPTLAESPSVLTWSFRAGVKHRTWFQPLLQAIHALPQVPVFEPGAIGYDLAREHPSPLIRDWRDYDDIDDLIEKMIEEVVVLNVRRRLVELIEERIAELGG